MEEQKKDVQLTRCSSCGRSIPKSVAVTVQGKVFCCPDCAQGKTCDCQ